jgi:hypothetical protein
MTSINPGAVFRGLVKMRFVTVQYHKLLASASRVRREGGYRRRRSPAVQRLS